MKITDVESFTVEVPAEKDAVEAGVINKAGVTRIKTDEGLTGYGWGTTPQEQLEGEVKPLLLGQHPCGVERFLSTAPDFVNWPYVEHALWDLVGKIAGQPVHRLWGAHKSELRAYVTCVWRGHKPDHSDVAIEAQAAAAEKYCALGFKGIKVRAWRPSILDDVELCREIKRRVGDSLAVMFDRTAHAPGWVWTYEQALEVARGLETAGATWLEEPFERNDFDGLSRLAAETEIPVTGARASGAWRASVSSWSCAASTSSSPTPRAVGASGRCEKSVRLLRASACRSSRMVRTGWASRRRSRP